MRLLRAIRRRLGLAARVGRLERSSPSLIERAAWFVACEMIEGDYLEFGVYQGNSFAAAYRAFDEAFRRRIAQDPSQQTDAQRSRRRFLSETMRFVALDSFEGLPATTGPDATSDDFYEGQYRFGQESFAKSIARAGVPLNRVITIPGWYASTSHPETWEKFGIRKAAVVWIDCDLYASARDALAGLAPVIQDGTVLIFDDWFAFKANPTRGEQRAFAEWRETLPDYTFVPFHTEGVWRKAFIATLPDANPEG